MALSFRLALEGFAGRWAKALAGQWAANRGRIILVGRPRRLRNRSSPGLAPAQLPWGR